MLNYYGTNHVSLPVVSLPYGLPKHRLFNPGYSAQIFPPYGQSNPPPSNHLPFNYEARNDNNRSNEPRDKILYTVFYLCGQYRCLVLRPSEHRPRPKYTLQKVRCQNVNVCEPCRMANRLLKQLERVSDRTRLRESLDNRLTRLWIWKGRLFREGFTNSENPPPPFDSRQIMEVVLEITPNELEDEMKMQIQKQEQMQRRKEEDQRRQKEEQEWHPDYTMQNRSSQMVRSNTFSPDNEQGHFSLMARSYSQPWSWAPGKPERS